MTHILQRHGVRFVTFNKSGHTSLTNMFLTTPGGAVDRGASSKDEGRTLVGDIKQAATWPEPLVTGCFVRHPLARCVSAWNHLIRDHFYQPFKTYDFRPEMQFDQFVGRLLRILTSQNPENLDPHFRPQSIGLRLARGWLGHVQVMRLDEVETAWPQFVRTWEIESTLAVVHLNNKTYPNGDPWTAMYDGIATMAFKLLEHYADDLYMWENRAVYGR